MVELLGNQQKVGSRNDGLPGPVQERTGSPGEAVMETCYKMFCREVIQSIPIEENRFGFEPEITVKVARRRLRIYEVGISCWGRTYEEGKKIGWKDGVRAIYCLIKYSLKDPGVKHAPAEPASTSSESAEPK